MFYVSAPSAPSPPPSLSKPFTGIRCILIIPLCLGFKGFARIHWHPVCPLCLGFRVQVECTQSSYPNQSPAPSTRHLRHARVGAESSQRKPSCHCAAHMQAPSFHHTAHMQTPTCDRTAHVQARARVERPQSGAQPGPVGALRQVRLRPGRLRVGGHESVTWASMSGRHRAGAMSGAQGRLFSERP